MCNEMEKTSSASGKKKTTAPAPTTKVITTVQTTPGASRASGPARLVIRPLLTLSCVAPAPRSRRSSGGRGFPECPSGNILKLLNSDLFPSASPALRPVWGGEGGASVDLGVNQVAYAVQPRRISMQALAVS